MIQGLTINDSSDSLLPGDNYPYWLAYTSEGPSVRFEVPEDCDGCLKGITLYVVYSSMSENMETECLISVLIINYTKFTLHIYKRDTVMSFNDEDWQSVVSNLEVGDNMGIFVAFGHGLTVKKTVVYLTYAESSAMKIEQSNTSEVKPSSEVQTEPLPEPEMQPSSNVKTEPSPEEVQPSADMKMEPLPELEVKPSSNVKREVSPDVKMEPLPEPEVQPSPDVKREPSLEDEVQQSLDVKMEPSPIIKNEPLPKRNKKIFVRFSKRLGECLCLNRNRGLNNF
jgi:hypothetical protein